MKIFVSGVFDLFHAGHVEFLHKASTFGSLYVSIGSDATVQKLKKQKPIFSEQERLSIVQAIRYVHHAFIAQGDGILDFMQEIKAIQPDAFVVNKDGNRPEKRVLCEEMGIIYMVLERTPAESLPARSSTEIRESIRSVPGTSQSTPSTPA